MTAYGGGYVASGPPGGPACPSPLPSRTSRSCDARAPARCRRPLEGAGADRLSLGDRIWFRHAKAGELAERFTEFALVSGDGGDRVVGRAATYRGEGQCFG